MKFDYVIQNPPFANGLHEKFLLNMLKNSKHVVSVQPLSWLLGKRQNKKITEIIDNTKTDIEQINGNEFFDAAIGGTMGIISVDLTSDTSDIVFDGKAYSKCEEITTYSNDELLVEFKNIVELLAKKDNLDEHIKYTPNDKSHRVFKKKRTEYNVDEKNWCLRLTHYGSVYSILPSKIEILQYGEYIKKQMVNGLNDVKKNYLEFYYRFIDRNTAYNFVNYCKTDFARICIYMNKINGEMIDGTAKLVPWFDFSDPVFSKSPSEIDDYLFKKYNISNEIRNHIEEILPDYYGIRKT